MAAATSAQTFLPARNRVLIASADSSLRQRLMHGALHRASCFEEAGGGAHALARLKQIVCDHVLLDRHLPDLDSTELAGLIQKRYPGICVQFIDSQLAPDIQDPFPNSDQPEDFISTGDQNFATEYSLAHPRPFVSAEPPLSGMIGTSRAMQRIYRLARLVANHDTTVLITGETGTGKELVAAAIHEMSCRSRHPFVVVNCAAIPEALFEAELFGHARGAFTGASQSRLGRMHAAQGGTLFLDEIAELPLSMQAKLLRFLQNGEVQRLGTSDLCRVDVRVLCATNGSLPDLVRLKRFREDLFYRLAVFPITVPPLRERLEDIAALAAFFLARLCRAVGVAEKYLSAAALDFLQHSRWAGNVRELQHLLERAFILSGNEPQIFPESFGERNAMMELGEL